MIKLAKQANNLYRFETDDITIWFSYETPIAFEQPGKFTVNQTIQDYKMIITKNIWSPTTGKHLNIINPDKDIRIDHNEFMKLLEEALQ